MKVGAACYPDSEPPCTSWRALGPAIATSTLATGNVVTE
jgi:hypothetical protein